MKKLFSIICLLFLTSVATPAFAQDDPQLVDTGAGIVVEKPDAWVSVNPSKGAVAVLRAAGDERSQIELRMTPNLTKQKAPQFFSSFHANLLKAGFEKTRSDRQTYGSLAGTETEYGTSSNGKPYRLVVFQFHRDEKAWLVVGFFDADKRDTYYQDFQKVLNNLRLDQG